MENPINNLPYERNWAEYFTSCPNGMLDELDMEVLVGSYECEMCCPFYVSSVDGGLSGTVACKYKPYIL